MTASYSKTQQIHSLSVLSNAAFGYKFPDFNKLQHFVTTVIQQTLADKKVQQCLGSDWQLVWGPVVFCNNPHAAEVVADNTMMLLYSPSQNLFVVAIAGTNIYSMYGWFEEDLKVNKTVSWKEVVGNHNPLHDWGAIAEGTSIGLMQLLKMTDSSNKTMIQALQDYLSKAGASAEVAVSGHSLGGALTPVMAMYLKDTMKNWNPKNVVTTVSAYPTAGPTAGNDAFAKHAEKNLVYASYYNDIDVVPKGWQRDTLAQVPTIYGNHIAPPQGSTPFNTAIGMMCVGAAANTYKMIFGKIPEPINYTQISPWIPMKGNFDKATDDAVIKKFKYLPILIPQEIKEYVPFLVNVARFLAQLGYQHLDAYIIQLKIEEFNTNYEKVKDKNAPSDKKKVHFEAMGKAMSKLTGLKSLESLHEE